MNICKINKLFGIIIIILFLLLLSSKNKQLFTIGSQVMGSNEGGVVQQEYLANTSGNNSGVSGEDYGEVGHSSLLNIYGESLKRCKTGTDRGSWDSDGFCSEMGGGVHQICFNVTENRSNFSTVTGQSDWSVGRVGNNHCMCLGAYALYKAKGEGIDDEDDELVCDSIPEQSLTSTYINNWNTWNNHELSNQIINGVDSLVAQCFDRADNDEQRNYLINKYDVLRNEYTNINWESIFENNR
tara:strand:+ start:29 stop:751 length:723 start_codon:yes stop_codon:yes gene_type:complete